MKKALTLGLLALGFIFQQANAQIGKGEKMIGGSVGFTSSKTEYKNLTAPESTNNTFTITPQLGFGLGNNWIVGLGVSYVSTKQETTQGSSKAETKTSAVSPGIFVRKFHQFGDKFGIYGQLDAEYAFGEQKTTQTGNPDSKSEISGYGISASPGLFYKASRKFVIEATIGRLGYSSLTTKPDGSSIEVKNKQFTFALTNDLSLGFKLIF